MDQTHRIYCPGPSSEAPNCGRPIHITIRYAGGMEVLDVSYHEACGHRFDDDRLTYMVATDPDVEFEDGMAFADYYNPDEEGYP